jgi:acyl transferase domain-containing protein/acyl carrier protein
MSTRLEPESQLSSSKRALIALKRLQAKIDALEYERTEPIAIIGLGCRFPGGAHDPESYWQLLAGGVDAVVSVPPERWDAEAHYDANPEAPGKMYTRHGGFLTGIDGFDPAFFGIAPREALYMDPQHRLLLEVAWEAFENAGLAPDRLAGSATGVFVGISTNDYAQLTMGFDDPARITTYSGTGITFCIAAGRLSYALGLQGPSLAVDTACSASLVTIHLACQSLRQRECNLALAGGVNLIHSPLFTIAMCQLKALSPEGRCKTFDARADGFVRSEGCGLVVLKRLSDAVADGDRVLAVIRGSAVNQDGKSSGLTAPNGLAQEAVLRQALANAGLSPAQVNYVEAHGTGTPLGDPIEVQALGAVFGRDHSVERPLWIGSVKTNLGHLEAAAGIAGVIKVVLALQHQHLPPHLHLQQPNPHIPWDQLPVEVVTQGRPWPAGPEPRRAGVSAFSLSGTNAHVVLEEAPQPAPVATQVPERPVHVLSLSAKTEPALRELAGRWSQRLGASTEAPADVCYTANTGRAHFGQRLAVCGRNTAELAAALGAYAGGNSVEGLYQGGGARPVVAILFTGQGSAYAGMGRELYDGLPAYRQALDDCARALDATLERPLVEALYGPDAEALLARPLYGQAALFSVEYSLARVWHGLGLEPAALLGHSLGEYAAACIAGLWPLDEAARLVALRGRLLEERTPPAAMAALACSAERAEALVAERALELALAADNGPDEVVVAGTEAAVTRLLERAAAAGVRGMRLTVGRAYHSPLVEPVLPDWQRAVAALPTQPLRLPLVSSVTGQLAGATELQEPGYWARQVRQPVRFGQAVRTLKAQGVTALVEVGPHPVLLGLATRAWEGQPPLLLPSLRRGRGAWETLLDSLAQWYTRGGAMDWAALDQGQPRRRLALPTYPFQRQRFWIEAQKPAQVAHSGSGLDQWLYQLAWLPGTPAAPLGPARLFSDLTQLATELGEVADQLGADPDLAPYHQLLPQLEELSLGYVVQAFQELGWPGNHQQTFTLEELAQHWGVPDRYTGLLRRVLVLLSEGGILRFADAHWQVLRVPQRIDSESTFTALIADHPDCRPELHMVRRCGGALAEVLRGRQEPLPLLFPGGKADEVEHLYQRAAPARAMNGLVAEVFRRVVAAMPPGRTLRVLEVGAGTGGTTAAVLPVLPAGRADYVFTDVSPLFLARARAKFAAYAFVRCQLLDLEQEPSRQGLAGQRFDVVLAANVLHATADLRRTLRHLRTLLAPGGLLVLLEGTGPRRWIDLTFGLTEGWWKFTDRDLRPDYLLLPPARWQELLAGDGWDGAVAVPPAATPLAEVTQQMLLVAQAGGGAEPGSWLVLADRGGVGAGLATRLRQQGQRCVLMHAAEAAGRLAEDEYAVRPEAAEEFQGLWQEVQRPGQPPWRGVVHLWGLDSPAGEQLTAANLAAAQQAVCGSALHLAQTLLQSSAAGTPAPRLWLVTRGAVAVGAAPLTTPLAALVWGMARTLVLEHPELACVRLDLDPDGDRSQEVEVLATELLTPDQEDQVAWRNGIRHTARLVRGDTAKVRDAPFDIRADGTYLITGGLGGLGLRVAGWLIDLGARHIVLAGRGGDRATEDQLKELAQGKARVAVRYVDAAAEGEMQQLLLDLEQTFPPLRGVMHAAAVVHDGILLQQDWNQFTEVLAPKVQGSWLLHLLTQHRPLDFFVLFSSAASLVGSPGQSSYAAANAFLDALAHYRRAQGLPALSINWGAWSDVGIAAKRNLGERIAKRGLGPMSPEEALQAMTVTLKQDWGQVGILAMQWARFLEGFPGNIPPYFSLLAAETRARQPQPSGPVALTDLRRQLQQVPAGRGRELLRDAIHRQAVRVLGLGPAQTIEPHQPLQELGLDSLMAVELRNALSVAVGRTLPTTLLFDYPTLEALTTHLGRDLLSSTDGKDLQEGSGPAEERDQLLNKIKQIPEEMIQSELLQELQTMNY